MPEHNRFLEASFAPVTEEITAFDLPVTGTVPAGLNGRYLRNGPNPLGLDDPHYHWFLGINDKFQIEDLGTLASPIAGEV